MFLQRTTGLTKGNLSSHLAKLEDAGLIAIEKRFVRKRPNTSVGLTPLGRERIARHWDQLDRLKKLAARSGGPSPRANLSLNFTFRVAPERAHLVSLMILLLGRGSVGAAGRSHRADRDADRDLQLGPGVEGPGPQGHRHAGHLLARAGRTRPASHRRAAGCGCR